MKLDIGCGASKPEGWTGIDVAKVPGVDIVHDLFQFKWPIPDDSVDEARCIHFVEHIPHREAPYIEVDATGSIEFLAQDRWARSMRKWGHVIDLWWDFWTEVHRVMKDGARIQVVTPFYSSVRADQDPTHERRIAVESYHYLNQGWLERNRCAYPFAANFELESVTHLLMEDPPAGREAKYDLNVVADIAVVLKVVKPSGCWWKK